MQRKITAKCNLSEAKSFQEGGTGQNGDAESKNKISTKEPWYGLQED